MLAFAIIIAIVGSLIAGLWDLFTTEIPDEIPVLMIAIGIGGWFIHAMTTGDFSFLVLSLVLGSAFLLFGWLLYKTGQWGGGDALLLGAILFLVPTYPLPVNQLLQNELFFAFSFLINVFIVGVVYMIVYTIVLGIMKRHVWAHYKRDLAEQKKYVIGIPLLFAVILFIPFLAVSNLGVLMSLWSLLIIIFLVFFWRYALVIEKKLFTKKILTKNLKPGDVIKSSKKWVGITEDDIKSLRRKKYITIKEGVRFAPVFFIALIVTLLYGNIILLVIL